MTLSVQGSPDVVRELSIGDRRWARRAALTMLAIIAVAFAMAACNSIPPILKATPQVVATRYAALMIGKLVLVDNCLRVNSIYSNESELLIWPPDFDVRMNNDTVEIVDRTMAKRAVWHVGEVVTLGGGEVYRTNDGERPLFSANCLGPYWIVGDVVVPPTVTPGVKWIISDKGSCRVVVPTSPPSPLLIGEGRQLPLPCHIW